MVYSVHQSSARTWASSRLPKVSVVRNSSRKRPLKDSQMPVFPRCAGFDKNGAYRAEASPISQGVTGQFGSVGHPDVFGLAARGQDQPIRMIGGLIGVPGSSWPDGQRLAGELVNDVAEAQLKAIDGQVVLIVQRPHMIGAGRGPGAVAPAPGPRRMHLRVFGRRCSRSSFHNRCVRFGLTTKPGGFQGRSQHFSRFWRLCWHCRVG